MQNLVMGGREGPSLRRLDFLLVIHLENRLHLPRLGHRMRYIVHHHMRFVGHNSERHSSGCHRNYCCRLGINVNKSCPTSGGDRVRQTHCFTIVLSQKIRNLKRVLRVLSAYAEKMRTFQHERRIKARTLFKQHSHV